MFHILTLSVLNIGTFSTMPRQSNALKGSKLRSGHSDILLAVAASKQIRSLISNDWSLWIYGRCESLTDPEAVVKSVQSYAKMYTCWMQRRAQRGQSDQSWSRHMTLKMLKASLRIRHVDSGYSKVWWLICKNSKPLTNQKVNAFSRYLVSTVVD
jgi:hypothetical protein